jgi:hypothetical protein
MVEPACAGVSIRRRRGSPGAKRDGRLGARDSYRRTRDDVAWVVDAGGDARDSDSGGCSVKPGGGAWPEPAEDARCGERGGCLVGWERSAVWAGNQGLLPAVGARSRTVDEPRKCDGSEKCGADGGRGDRARLPAAQRAPSGSDQRSEQEPEDAASSQVAHRYCPALEQSFRLPLWRRTARRVTTRGTGLRVRRRR